MNAKTLLSLGLLLFVAAAVAILVAREVQRDIPAKQSVDSRGTTLPERAVVAYYFHGETRCPTCRRIESLSQEAIQTGFPDQLAAGGIEWRVVNYELPANVHFATDYEIVAPTVVLVRKAEGRVAEWRNLKRVWELVGDKEAFLAYIHEQTREMLNATGG